eukprot:c20873_g1_i3 orf=179-553(+)
MTVEEVLERSTEVTTFLKKHTEFGKDLALENDLKLGIERDIQDFCGRYFDYDEFPLFIHDKIRLKNGFIDKTRGLLWKEFTTNFVTNQLTEGVEVNCKLGKTCKSLWNAHYDVRVVSCAFLPKG